MKKIVITFELKRELKVEDREDRRELADLVAEEVASLDLKSRLEYVLSETTIARKMSGVKRVNVSIEG